MLTPAFNQNIDPPSNEPYRKHEFWQVTRGAKTGMRRWFACLVCFLLSVEIASETHPRPNKTIFREQHGLDHPGVVIDVPMLKCKCKDSEHETTSSGREYEGHERSSEASACREEGEVYWIVSVRGLVPGFVYEVHFQFSLQWSGENAYHWKTGFTSSTSSYTVRYPLQRIQKTRVLNRSVSDQGPFFVEITLRDMHPGLTSSLTSEEALIGTRRLDSAVNTVRVHCADLESGEREEPLDLSKENSASDDSTVGGGDGLEGTASIQFMRVSDEFIPYMIWLCQVHLNRLVISTALRTIYRQVHLKLSTSCKWATIQVW
jgi:hypothetical protein